MGRQSSGAFANVKRVCQNAPVPKPRPVPEPAPQDATPDGPAGRAQRAVQSVEVGGRLLLALAGVPEPLALKALAARADMPASRAHPYLVSFARLGLVVQDAPTGRYALGPAALQLGLTALHQCDPVRVAQPVAQALADATGQAVALAVWGNFGPTVIRLIDAQQPLHVAMRAGTVMALFGTATGRAYAAAMTTAQVADALACVALGADDTPRRVDRRALEAQLAPLRQELAQHGCTRAVGKPIPGVNAFAALVRDHSGAPVLAFTLLGLQENLPAAWSSPLATAVKQAAAEVSAKLGHRPGLGS